MSKKELLSHTMSRLENLPIKSLEEVADFADFIAKKHEEKTLLQGVTFINSQSSSFQFLEDEEDLYTIADLKERF